ncbi:MAG: hypothetical protein WCJ25_01610 [Candidatus Moraniibacteriota bacterium]
MSTNTIAYSATNDSDSLYWRLGQSIGNLINALLGITIGHEENPNIISITYALNQNVITVYVSTPVTKEYIEHFDSLESSLESRSPIVKALFAIPGIEELFLQPYETDSLNLTVIKAAPGKIMIVKGGAFEWSELLPLITDAIAPQDEGTPKSPSALTEAAETDHKRIRTKYESVPNPHIKVVHVSKRLINDIISSYDKTSGGYGQQTKLMRRLMDIRGIHGVTVQQYSIHLQNSERESYDHPVTDRPWKELIPEIEAVIQEYA